VKVFRFGRGLAIRVPAAVADELKLKARDNLDIRVTGPDHFTVMREMTREEAIARLRIAGHPLPPGFKFNRDAANAR